MIGGITELAGRVIVQPARRLGEIHLIGCGGIGGRILPALVKMIDRVTNIYLWDDDRVEVKNLIRQNFTIADVGHPKAEVLARRYSTPIARCHAKVQRWTIGEDTTPDNAITISAIDTWETRRDLLGRSMYGPVIDCGNDGDRGQVLLGGVIDSLPVRVIETFPELLEPAPVDPDNPISCETGDTQTVLANTLAATIALSYFHVLRNGLAIGHVGTWFSLPHGVWEIPAALALDTWRGQDFNQRLIVMPGWNKSQAGTWRAEPLIAPRYVTERDPDRDGWTPDLVGVVETALFATGAERGCSCSTCRPKIVRVLREFGLTDTPPPLVGRWPAVNVAEPAPATPQRAHGSRILDCESCGGAYRLRIAIDRGVDDPQRFCSIACETEDPDPDRDYERDEDPPEDDR